MTTVESVTTTIAGITSGLVAADHLLARSESVIQNSIGPFLWALISRKPIRPQKGVQPMAHFNFDKFLSNFGAVAEKAAVTYETKRAAGTSLHQMDYVGLAIPAFFAIVSAFQTPAATTPSVATTPNNPDGSQPIV